MTPKAVTPSSLAPWTHETLVEVSLDGTYFFAASMTFQYRVPPMFLSVTPISQSIWGESLLQVEGVNFVLGSIPICRFIFPSSVAQVDLAGTLVSGSLLTCNCPRHLLTDNEIILQVSFNNQEYYEVTSIYNTLDYQEKAHIESIFPTFGFADQGVFATPLHL